jgi:ATP-binding protein involved in chromosome partitioning
MSLPTVETVESALGEYVDPYLHQNLVSAGAIKGVKSESRGIAIEIELGFPVKRYAPLLEEALRRHLSATIDLSDASFRITAKIAAHAVQKGVKRLPDIKNIIAIASGKGGVGKSTTAVNIAVALENEGATVGLLDADIYGPSQPRMLGCAGTPESKDGRSLEPMVSYNVQAMSIGNLVDEETPMIWRGPMVTSALEQLLTDTNWREVDYLVVDLPPGTGDIQLTLCQKIPVSGAVIVTTPQDIALLDARKGLRMFEKVDVPVLGIVENMSTHICSNCGHEEHIFGAGGGAHMAAQYKVELLGSLPLDVKIREGVDNGRPTVALDPDSPASGVYREIARKIAAKLALRAKDYSAKFPKIVVQST